MKRSRLTLFVFLAAWLGSLGAVYILGLFSAFAFHRAPGEGGMEGLDLQERAYSVLTERVLGEPVEWAALKSTETEDALPEQVQSLVVALDREPEFARRTNAADTIAAVYPSRKVVPGIQQLLGVNRGPGRDALLGALFHRWGGIDGRSALDFTLTAVPDRDLASRMVAPTLAGMAAARPEMAWNWALQNPAPSGADQASRLATVLAAADGLGTETVAKWLAQFNNPALAEEVAGREAVRRLATQGVRAAFNFAEMVTSDYAGRVAVLSDVVAAWTDQDLSTVRSWYAGLEADTRSWALPAIARSWSQRDGASALRWLGDAPPSPDRSEAVRVAALNWLQEAGPAPLGEFLNATDDLSGYSPAIEMLALETMSLDPETAFSWATLIGDPARRRFVTATVASAWLAEEPQAAERAMRETGLLVAQQARAPTEPAAVPVAQPAEPAQEEATNVPLAEAAPVEAEDTPEIDAAE